MNKSDWETILVQVVIKLFVKWLEEEGLGRSTLIGTVVDKAEANPAGLSKVVKRLLFEDSERIIDIIAERLWERMGKE